MSQGFRDLLGTESWWETYKGYILFGAGAVAGWTLGKLFASPTVVVRTSPSVSGLRRKRRGMGFGEIALDPPWEQVSPRTFVRREKIGNCGEVVASVTCGPRRLLSRYHKALEPAKVLCTAEVAFTDPFSGAPQRMTLRPTGGQTTEQAAEAALLEADLEVARLRWHRCYANSRRGSRRGAG
jgi:hypothetical protein